MSQGPSGSASKEERNASAAAISAAAPASAPVPVDATDLDRRCVSEIAQLDRQRERLTSEAAGLRGRATSLRTHIDEIYGTTLKSFHSSHVTVPHQLDLLVEERAQQITHSIAELDKLELFYRGIRPLLGAQAVVPGPLTAAAAAQPNLLLVSLQQAIELAALNGNNASDGSYEDEHLFAALINACREEGERIFAGFLTRLEELAPTVSSRDDHPRSLRVEPERTEIVSAAAPLDSVGPALPVPDLPQEYTNTEGGVTTTRIESSALPRTLPRASPYENGSVTEFSMSGAHGLTSGLMNRPEFLIYDNETREIHRHLGRRTDWVEQSPTMTLLPGTSYFSDNRVGSESTIFVTPPRILRVEHKGRRIIFNQPEMFIQIVEVVALKCVIGLGVDTIFRACVPSLVPLARKGQPPPSVGVKFTRSYRLAPFTGTRTVLAVYEHYLILFCGPEYSVCKLSSLILLSRPLPPPMSWAENHSADYGVTDCCVDSVHRCLYLVTTEHKISVHALCVKEDGLILIYDAQATLDLNNYINAEVSRVHWTTASPRSLFFVLRDSPGDLHELTGLDYYPPRVDHLANP